MEIPNSLIRDELLRQVDARGHQKSICPGEVARALAPDWQRLMTRVRKIALELAREERIEILRKGKPVDQAAVNGVIRLRRKGSAPAAPKGGDPATPEEGGGALG